MKTVYNINATAPIDDGATLAVAQFADGFDWCLGHPSNDDEDMMALQVFTTAKPVVKPEDVLELRGRWWLGEVDEGFAATVETLANRMTWHPPTVERDWDGEPEYGPSRGPEVYASVNGEVRCLTWKFN